MTPRLFTRLGAGLVLGAVALLLVGLALFVVDTSLAGFGVTTAAATAAFGVGSWFVFGTGLLRNPGWVAVATTLVALGFWVVIMTVILRAQAGPDGIELERTRRYGETAVHWLRPALPA